MIRLRATEGQPLEVDRQHDDSIRAALARLQATLKPRIAFSTEELGRPVIRNLVGTVRLGPAVLLEVAPKVGAAEDWVTATLDLLSNQRIEISGQRQAGTSPRRPDLLDALAASYAQRLRRALRRDGPLLVLQRMDRELGVLRGRLHLSSYLQHYPVKPHRFPVTFDLLSADNEFTRAMALVARELAAATRSFEVRATLLECAAALRPGFADYAPLSPNVTARALPPQWSVYAPAWSIAVAVLSRSSLLRSNGQHQGLEMAIEAWPLLEALLFRVLATAAIESHQAGRDLTVVPKGRFPLLTNPSAGATARRVEPDGELSEGGQTLATFEAKYSQGPSGGAWPPEDHYYQALATAAAKHSPIAVLVYPGDFEPTWWDVEGFHGHPANLVAIGLRLFSYRRGTGEVERAGEVLKALAGRPMVMPAPAEPLSVI